MNNNIIRVQNLSKSFHVGNQDVPILKDITFEVNEGDFMVIFGPSGCGKSTLLHTILGLEEPTIGRISILSRDIYWNKTEDDRSDFRKQHIGMVYQQPNWIQSLTVVENVAFPLLLLGQSQAQSLTKAKEVLTMVNIIDWANYTPTELSSGQQQRVALARALVTNPELLIADEPTGNLDYESGQGLMKLLSDLNKTRNNTIVMVTHDLEYLDFAKTMVKMLDGRIIGIYEEKEKGKLLTEIKGKRGSEIKMTIKS
jgi:putative ABC transport system ATP-binding protein